MRINHNLAALNEYSKLVSLNQNQSKSLEKLSSGYRINKAGDDAAGLAISEKMRAQIKGLQDSSRNYQDSISMIQTTEGSLAQTHSVLQRMREIAVQAGNGTNDQSDRDAFGGELKQLSVEMDRIAKETKNFKKRLLADSNNVEENMPDASKIINNAIDSIKEITSHTGAKSSDNSSNGVDVSTQGKAANLISNIDSYIKSVSKERSKLGAYTKELEEKINNLGTSSDNLTAAESRIKDTDMAKEMMEFTKNNILNQASTAMLAQANQQPQGVLQLLR